MVVTWPRWLPCPYMVKTLQKFLFWNRWTDFHETWYVASMTPAHHSLFKWWSWVDLDLFYGKVNFGNKGFSIGKSENYWFFRTFAVCDLKLHKIMKICEYWRSRSFLDRDPKSVTYESGFSQKPLGQSKPIFICKLSGSRKWKFIDMMLITWPKWLPRPHMVKTLQKSSSLELVDWFPQNLVCHNLFKWWPWVDLDLFYGKVKFGN